MAIPACDTLLGVIPARMRITAVIIQLAQLAQRRHLHRRTQGCLHLCQVEHLARVEGPHQLLSGVLNRSHMLPLGLVGEVYIPNRIPVRAVIASDHGKPDARLQG